MKRLLNTLLVTALSLTLVSCASSTDADSNGGNENVTVANGKVTWKIGGETKLVNGLAIRNNNNTPPTVTIMGQWDGQGPMTQANLTIYSATTTGTFDIIPGTPPEAGKASATINQNGDSRVALGGTGQVKITKFEGKHIEGKFTFKTINALTLTDTLTVTDGEFNIDFLI